MEERDPRRSREHSEQLPQKKKARNSSSAKQDAASKSSIDFILNDDPDPTSSCSGGQRSGEQESKPNSGTKSSSGGSAELEETSSEVSSDNSDRGKNNASQHPQTTHRSSSSAYGATSSSTERDSPSASILQIQPCACSSLEVTGNDFSQVHGSSLPSVSNQTHPQASVAPAMESAVYNQSDGPDEIEVQENSSPRTTSNGPRMSASRGGSSSDGERGFTCSQCNKAFKERGNLNKHFSSVHEGVRPFECRQPGCTKTFSFKDGLLRHEATVHRMERPYECPHCEKTFKQLSHLNKHLRSAIHRRN